MIVTVLNIEHSLTLMLLRLYHDEIVSLSLCIVPVTPFMQALFSN